MIQPSLGAPAVTDCRHLVNIGVKNFKKTKAPGTAHVQFLGFETVDDQVYVKMDGNKELRGTKPYDTLEAGCKAPLSLHALYLVRGCSACL